MLATETLVSREAFDLADLPDDVDLVAELRRVNEKYGHEGAPCWFLFNRDEFLGLTVGLHGDRGALLWDDGTTPMVPAQGTKVEPVDYFTGGVHHFTFPAGAELPLEPVLNAVGEYIRTAKQPMCVEWVTHQP